MTTKYPLDPYFISYRIIPKIILDKETFDVVIRIIKRCENPEGHQVILEENLSNHTDS